MAKQLMKVSNKKSKLCDATGFSIPELLIVILIISIASAFAVLTFRKSNQSFKLAGATRILSTYLEKARMASVRRHGGATVDINSSASYTVNLDFDGAGAPVARTITLPEGTSLSYTLPPLNTSTDPSITPITITYDWRGRAGTTILLTLTDSTTGVGSSTVVVGPEGDVSTDTTVTGPATVPTPQTTVGTTTGIKSMQ
jgi:prepilin-type N-terminal cleavage/methylation domain-containing protein